MAIVRQREKLRPGQATVVGVGTINPGAVEVVFSSFAAALAPTAASVSGLGALIPYVAPYAPPSWATIPTLTFVDGIASNASIAGYLTDSTYAASTLTATGTALPAGVTLDSTNRQLVYDGTPTTPLPSTTTGHTLTADDGYDVTGTEITDVIVEEPSGTMGVVLKKGDLPAGRYLSATGVSGWQAKVKSRWPDGSARIAVCSWNDATITGGSNRTITLRSAASEESNLAVSLATLRASGFNGNVTFTAGPSPGITGVTQGNTVAVDFATLITSTPHRTWQAGPQCSEWHWWAPVGSDPTLTVWLYVRLYASGRIWTRVTIENGYCNATQSGKRYHAAITINGTSRYDTSSDTSLWFPQYNGNNVSYGTAWYWPWTLGDSIAHSSRSRWTKSFWYDADPLRAVCHDGLYLSATKLFPNYGWRNTPTNLFGASPAASVPLRLLFSSYDQKQASSPMIGHNFDFMYVFAPQGTSYQKAEFHSMVARSEEFGHKGQFFRDENTHESVLWSARPTLSYAAMSANTHWAPVNQDAAHDPLWGFSAYLCTGDFFHLETIQVRATSFWVSFGPAVDARDGVKGIIYGWDVQTRAWAWTFRTFGAAAVCTPDVPDAGTYQLAQLQDFKNCLYYNAERQVQQFIDGTLTGTGQLANKNEPNTFGLFSAAMSLGNYAYKFNGTTYQGEGPWQQHYCSVAAARVESFEILTGTQQAMLTRLVDHGLKFGLNMFGDENGWPYTHAGCYNMPLAKNISGTWVRAPDLATAYTWWLERYPGVPDQRTVVASQPLGAPFLNTTNAMISESDANIHNGYTASPQSWVGYHWGNLHCVIAMAIDRGGNTLAQALVAKAKLESLTGPVGVVPAGAADYAGHAAYFENAGFFGEVPRT